MRVRVGRNLGDEPIELGMPSDFRVRESVHIILRDADATQLLRHAVAWHPEVLDALRRLLAMVDPGWSVSRMRDHRILDEVMWRVRGGQLWFTSPRRREAMVATTSSASAQAEPPPPPPRPRRIAAEPTSAPGSSAPSDGVAAAQAHGAQSPSAGQAGGPVGGPPPLLPLKPTSAAESQARGDQGPSAGEAEGPVDSGKPFKPDKNKTGFIEVELVDDEGTPLAGKPFRIILPDESRAEGKLNAQGVVRLEGFDPGDCAVIFQKLSPAD